MDADTARRLASRLGNFDPEIYLPHLELQGVITGVEKDFVRGGENRDERRLRLFVNVAGQKTPEGIRTLANELQAAGAVVAAALLRAALVSSVPKNRSSEQRQKAVDPDEPKGTKQLNAIKPSSSDEWSSDYTEKLQTEINELREKLEAVTMERDVLITTNHSLEVALQAQGSQRQRQDLERKVFELEERNQALEVEKQASDASFTNYGGLSPLPEYSKDELTEIGHVLGGIIKENNFPLSPPSVLQSQKPETVLEALTADNLKSKNRYGYTLLGLVVAKKCWEAAEWLVTHKKCDPNILIKSEVTPLLIACEKNAPICLIDWMLRFSPRGAVNIGWGDLKKTPLLAATDHLELMKHLHEKWEADIDQGDFDGETVLHYSALLNRRRTAEWLIQKGAMATRNRDGCTPAEMYHRNYHGEYDYDEVFYAVLKSAERS